MAIIGSTRPAGSVVLTPSSLLRSRGSGSGRKSRNPSRGGGGGGGGRKSRTRGHRLQEGGGGGRTAPGTLVRPPPPAGQQFQCYVPPPLAVPSGAAGADGGSWDRPRRREGRSDREEGGSGRTEGGRASAPAPALAPAPTQFCMDGGAEAKTGADGDEGWIHKAAAPEGEVVQQEDDDDEEVEEDGPRSARRSKEPARREGRGPTADADPPERSGEDPRESEGGMGQPRPTTSLSREAERGLKEAHRNACGYLKVSA